MVGFIMRSTPLFGVKPLPDILFILLVCGVLFFFGTGTYRLIDIDEPHYAETAREMIELKSWITPYFNYELRFDKPALFYWLIILSYKLFGVTEFAARAVSGVLATLLALALYFFGTYTVSPRTGFLAALVAASSLIIIGLARMAITDMALCVFISLTILSLYLVSRARQHNRGIWWLAGAFFAALACLTKGPVGIVVPGCVFLLYSIARKEFKQNFLTQWFLIGLLAWFCLTFPWYLLAWRENGQVFIDALIHHNMGRYTARIIEHQYPWYFYFVVVLLGFLPWSVFLPASIRNWLLEKKHQNASTDLALYALIWATFIFVFFSFAQTKLLTYIVSLFPALALWIAVYLSQLVETTSKQTRNWAINSAFFMAIASFIPIIGVIYRIKQLFPSDIHNVIRNPAFTGVNILFFTLLMLGAWGFWFFLRKGKIITAVQIVCVTLAIFLTVCLKVLFPHIKVVAKQNTLYDYVQKANGKPLATYQLIQPSLIFYAKRPVSRIELGDKQSLITLVKAYPQGTYLVTSKKYLEHFEKGQMISPAFHWRLVNGSKHYSLLFLTPAVNNTN